MPLKSLIGSAISFVLILILDVSGCIYGVDKMSGLMETERGGTKVFVPGFTASLTAACLGTMIAALTGCSPIIVHIESVAGVAVGGRTGLTGIVIATLFSVVLRVPSFKLEPQRVK